MIQNSVSVFTGSRSRIRTFVFAILIFYGMPVWSQPLITLKNSDQSVKLRPYAEYHRDPAGTMTLEDIRSLNDSGWRNYGSGSANFGYTNDIIWVRFRLKDVSSSKAWILESAYPTLDRISLFKPEKNGSYTSSDTGRLLPYSHREIDNKNYLFKLYDVDDARPYYVRFQSQSSLVTDLTVWQTDFLMVVFDRERLFGGMFYGIMLVMVLYNFSIFIGVRDKAYLYYSIFQSFAALFFFTLEGYASHYLFPNTPELGKQCHLIFGGLGHMFSFLFVQEFLRLKDAFPAGRLMIRLMLISCIMQISSPVIGYHLAAKSAHVANIFGPLVIILCAAVCLARGFKTARFLLIAWIVPMLALGNYALARLNIIPISFMTEHSTQIGIAAEAWLLSLALASRFFQVHKELEKAHDKLLTLDRMKDDFLATTSHELKTPLIGIGGIAESLMDGDRGKLPAETLSDLGMIVSSTRRLTGLVNDLLDLSRIKYRDLKLRKSRVDIRQVADMVMAFYAPLIQGRPIELKNRIGGDIPLVFGDENRLQQVMYNLIDNAVKFTESGEITVNAECFNDFVKVTVEDTGIGIPESKFDDIFTYFEQGDSSITRKYGGAGIGLSITKQLIEMQGGFIMVESQEGTGSKFIFTLPVYKEEIKREDSRNDTDLLAGENDMKPALMKDPAFLRGKETVNPVPSAMISGQNGSGNGRGTKKASILIVDDEPINLRVLESQLRQADYSVMSVSSGPLALEHIEKSKMPDIMLLDIMMPGMSGYEVCGILRNKFSLHELPIIMITVRNQVVDLITGFEAGANDYLAKPFDKRELLARVNTLVTLKRTVKKYEESRYKNLQERTNPHFLFNAINTIHALLNKDVEKADNAVIMLADIFRFLMDTSFQPLIPFDTEWEFINTYLKFESLRFPETIRFEMEKNGDFKGVMIPPLTVQPLAENSIKHGIRHKIGGGKISIQAVKEGNLVRVIIEDDGIGLQKTDIYSRTLGNIRNMLKFHYKTSDLTVYNRKESGAGAEISFALESRG